ncbi:hypothetical protein K474DRAFT_1656762 [Panus rudis PR-1116 ss-1]|nr:hypothetical protein K474DRAFT_1656762 [Panus rudis PR-1116 ss-1]
MSLMGGLTTALEMLRDVSNLTPLAQLAPAVEALTVVLKGIEATQDNFEDVETLSRRIQDLSHFLKNTVETTPASLENLRENLTRLTNNIQTSANSAKKIISRGPIRRFFRREKDRTTINRLNDELKHSMDAFMLAGMTRVQQDIELSAIQSRIESLPRAEAMFDSRAWTAVAQCYEGTREDTLGTIQRWIDNASKECPPVFWLYGPPGIGKTAVAKSVAAAAHKKESLGASFFFSVRIGEGCSEGTLLFPTIAYQLSLFEACFKSAVGNALGKDPDLGRKGIDNQYRDLFLKPLTSIQRADRPIFIIIDGLDECSDHSLIRIILRHFVKSLDQLRGRAKLFLASRPESYISEILLHVDGIVSYDQQDLERGKSSRDVELYLRHCLNDIAITRRWSTPWPPVEYLKYLVEQADGLFIFAVTVVRFTESMVWKGPEALLGFLKGDTDPTAKPLAPIDKLYRAILENALPGDDHDPDGFRLLISQLLGLIVPLQSWDVRQPRFRAIETLLRLPPFSAPDLLKDLHSVIQVPNETNGRISTYHRTFLDFIGNPNRIGERFSLSHQQRTELTLQIFERCCHPDVGVGQANFICDIAWLCFVVLYYHIGLESYDNRDPWRSMDKWQPHVLAGYRLLFVEKFPLWFRSLDPSLVTGEDHEARFHDEDRDLSDDFRALYDWYLQAQGFENDLEKYLNTTDYLSTICDEKTQPIIHVMMRNILLRAISFGRCSSPSELRLRCTRFSLGNLSRFVEDNSALVEKWYAEPQEESDVYAPSLPGSHESLPNPT